MYGPYQEWRKASYEETVALRELETEAQREMIAGGAAILAGVLAQTSGSRTTRSAGAVGVVGGGALLKSGLEKRANPTSTHWHWRNWGNPWTRKSPRG